MLTTRKSIDRTPADPPIGRKKEQKTQKAAASCPNSNRFAKLSLDNAQGAINILSEHEEHHTCEQDPKQSGFELTDETSTLHQCHEQRKELLFAIECFLPDMKEVREFVQETWDHYRSNKIDLATAAVATNSAVEIMRHTCDRITDQYRAIRGNAPAAFLASMSDAPPCIRDLIRIMNDDETGKESLREDDFSEVMELGNASDLPGIYLILCAFRDYLKAHKYVSMRDDPDLPYDSEVDRASLTTGENWCMDRFILLDALAHLNALHSLNAWLPVEDQINSVAKILFRTKEIPLSLVFAAQILLDTHHVFGPDIKKARQETELQGLRARQALSCYLSALKEHKYDTWWPESFDMFLEETVGVIDGRVMGNAYNIEGHARIPWSKIYVRHPVLAGLVLYTINLSIHAVGIRIANESSTVISMCHLAHAVRGVGQVNFEWKDMDKVMEFQSVDHLFVGGLPNSIDACASKNLLALGLPMRFVARNTRRRRFEPSMLSQLKEPRNLETTPIMDPEFPALSWERKTVTSLISVQRIASDLAKEDDGGSTEVTSPLQLLQAIRERVRDEQPKIMFNYLAVHTQVLPMVIELRTALRDEIIDLTGPKYVDYEGKSVNVVAYFLSALQRAEQILQNTRVKKLLGQDFSREKVAELMVLAAEAMKRSLGSRHDLACRELRAFCRIQGDAGALGKGA